ncbi:MAG: hypothetical protein IKY96_00600 [Oscillospiraceae bacterium]|nr:hypothetical protein [Oscillospiraceae bacterium]
MSESTKKVTPEESTELDQNVEFVPETKKGFLVWIKAHKPQLIMIGISIPTIIAVVLGLKNKVAIQCLWDKLSEELKKADLYSPKWFETVSDELLSTEREKVRLAYCSSGDNFSEANWLENLLRRFDKEMSKRACL